jgi:hypothetical protein
VIAELPRSAGTRGRSHRLGVRLDGDDGPEGRFATIEAAGEGLRVTTDPLRMLPVYTGCVAGRRVVTDSIREANGGTLPSALDPVGCASFVALGWPLRDRTLFDGWSLLPAGESLVRRDSVESAGDPFAAIDRDARRVSARETAREVLPRLARLAAERLRQDASTAVLLTGGQDSRVILTACLASGARPLCVTRGDDADPDVAHARRVAAVARCRHVTLREDPDRAAADWRALARVLIDRTDGMVSLWQVADVADHASPRTSWFGGIGGEIARRHWNQNSTLDRAASRAAVVAALHGRLAQNPGGLLREEVFAAFDRALRERLVELAEPLADPRDLPDVAYAKERVRQWGGANTRKLPPGHETLPLLASRVWYRAALTVPAEERVASELLREVVHRGAPRLLSIPLVGSEWTSLPRLRHWLRAREIRRLSRLREGSTAIERGRDALRARLVADLRAPVLDGGGPFFELFDRAAIERALAPSELASRDAATQALFAALTLWCVVAEP